MPVGYTPKAAGQWLFCGYTDDGATDTLASSSVNVGRSGRRSGYGSNPARITSASAVGSPASNKLSAGARNFVGKAIPFSTPAWSARATRSSGCAPR